MKRSMDKQKMSKRNMSGMETGGMPNGVSYAKIREVLKKILSDKELQDKLIISGGIVPWIIADKDSGRLHSDIDIICKQEDMGLIRDKLKEYGLYNERMDSMYYEHQDGLDYGVDTNISGVPVGFYPYDVKTVKTLEDGRLVDSDMIIQRSFTPPFVKGTLSGSRQDKPELKVKEMPGLRQEDYYEEAEMDGITFKHTSLELIRATKLKALRAGWRAEKDLRDIAQIDAIGTDKDKQARIESAMKNMKSNLDDKNRGHHQEREGKRSEISR